MSSTFYGLEIASKALFAAQKGLEVTGHNVANADTVGYSRQRLNTSSVEAGSGYVRFASAQKGQIGGGVTIDSVEQVRDAFLDNQYRRENSTTNQWSVRADGFSYIEELFDETSDTGLSQSFSDFEDSLEELSKDTTSKEYRTNVLQNALKLTETFNQYFTQLQDLQDDQNSSVKVLTDQINDFAKNIAALDDQINRYELNGETANDLRDSRNKMLDDLSSVIGIDYYEDSNGKLNIELGGRTLVSNTSYNTLQVAQTVSNPFTGEDNLYSVQWASDGEEVNVTSGKLKGYLDLIDGNSSSDIGIPYLLSNVNKLASSLVKQFNSIHAGGYTYPDTSNGNTSVSGVNFFTVPKDDDGNTIPVTAGNISINEDIINNVFQIAASSAQISSDDTKGNNENVLSMVDLLDRNDIDEIGGFNDYLKSLVAEVAVETSHTNTMLDSENSLVSNLETQRTSISGVSIDEEMTNLVKYQNSYSAAARVLTTIDQMLDTLINNTGMVGR